MDITSRGLKSFMNKKYRKINFLNGLIISLTSLILFVICPTRPATAQEHFVLDSFVGGGVHYSDNLYFDDADEESDLYFLGQLGANLTVPLYSRNFSMGLGYKLSFYYYTSASEYKDLHDFNLNVGFGKEFTKRPGFLRDLKVTLRDDIDTVARTVRPYGERDPLNMVQRNQLVLGPIYEHSFSRKLKLVGENQLKRVDYFGSDTNSFFGNDLSASLRRIMNRFLTLYGALDIMYRSFDKPDEFTYVGDYIGFQGRIGMDITWRRLTGGIFAGYGMYMIDGTTDFEVQFYGEPDPTSYSIEAEDLGGPIFMVKVNYLLTRMIELNASFNRYFRIDVAGEVIPTMMGRFQVIAKISKRLVIDGEASYQMYEDIKSFPLSIFEDREIPFEIDVSPENRNPIPDDFYDDISTSSINVLSFGLSGSYEFFAGFLVKAEFKYQSQDSPLIEYTYRWDENRDETISLGGEEYSRMLFGLMVQYNFKTIRFIL